eukprot:g11360.t1
MEGEDIEYQALPDQTSSSQTDDELKDVNFKRVLYLCFGAVLAVIAVFAVLYRFPDLFPLKAGDDVACHFLATADAGYGDKNQRAVGKQMGVLHGREPVDLVLLAGDNIYPDGDVKDINATFTQPYQELLAGGVPFYAVLGNHDIRTGNGRGQLEYPLFHMQKQRYYSFRPRNKKKILGPVEFFMLDTNVNARWDTQLPWLDKVLARSTAPWKVAVGHHPLLSSGTHGDSQELTARVGPLFSRYSVQLYIAGHDHHYERFVPINGTMQLVVGTGGSHLYPVWFRRPITSRAVTDFSFLEVTARPDRLVLKVWGTEGQLFDEAELTLTRPTVAKR